MDKDLQLQEVTVTEYDEGYKDGYKVGRNDGDCEGYERGYKSGHADGYESGYEDGEWDTNKWDEAYNEGLEEGKREFDSSDILDNATTICRAKFGNGKNLMNDYDALAFLLGKAVKSKLEYEKLMDALNYEFRRFN